MMKNHIQNLFIPLVGMFSFLLVVAMPAFAQKIDMSQIPDLPSFSAEMTSEQFYANSDAYEETPTNDPFLAYRVRLPAGWYKVDEDYQPAESTVQRDLKIQNEENQIKRRLAGEEEEEDDLTFKSGGGPNNLSQRVLVKVATYYGPATVGLAASRFEIRALKLDRQITAKNWYLQYVISNGFVLQGMKVLSDSTVEGLYAMVDKDYSYYVRSLVEINGPRVMVVSHYLPDEFWKRDRGVQEQIIKSFRFTSPDRTAPELFRTYNFLDMVDFDYPSSWRLEAPHVYSVEGMDAKLTNSVDKKTLAGQINIHIVSTELDTTLAQEVNYLKDEINKMGLKIGDLLDEPKDFKMRDYIYFNRVEVYHANNRRETLLDYEYWLAVMAESRYYYIVSMLTPARKANFYTWAQNTESFKSVVESFRQSNDEK